MNNNAFVFVKMTNEHAAEKEQTTEHKKKRYRIHIKPFWKMSKKEVVEGLLGCLGSTVIVAGMFVMALVF